MTVALAALAGVLLAAGLIDLAAAVTARRAAAPTRTTTSTRGGSPRPAASRCSRASAGGSASRRRPATSARAWRPPAWRRACASPTRWRSRPAPAPRLALAAAPRARHGLPLRLTAVALPAAATAGFLGPDLWLARRARRRGGPRRTWSSPTSLDLLRVAIAAGLPVGRALSEVGRRREGLVAAELRTVAERLALGVPRAEALAALQRSLPLPAIGLLAAAITRADRHGAPLAPALAALAREARADRARALHEQAARAAPRIQLAVALLLVPAVLLMVAAGLVHGLA